MQIQIVIDHHVLAAVTIVGLLLGVLGSIYLTYDLLGRAQFALHWLVRVVTPSLIGCFIMSVVGTIVYLIVYPSLDAGFGALLYGAIGCLVGAFNGMFVNPNVAWPPIFSFRHAIAGSIAAFCCVYIGELPVTLAVHRPWILALNGAVAVAVLGFIGGGIWTYANRVPSSFAAKPSLFSRRGALIGLLAATVFGGVTFFVIDVTFGVPWTASAVAALKEAPILAPAGAIVGGWSRLSSGEHSP